MSLATEAPWIEVFVIVSGDGGFVPLIRRLHALGKFVIVVANTKETTNKLLQAVADHFHFVGNPVDPEPEDLGPLAELPTRGEVLRRIKSIVVSNPNLISEDGVAIRGAALSQRLRQEIPGFSAGAYGSTLIELASDAIGTKLQDHGTYMQYRSASDQALPAAEEGPETPLEVPDPVSERQLFRLAPIDDWEVPSSRAEFRALVVNVLALVDVQKLMTAESEASGGFSLTQLWQVIGQLVPQFRQVGVAGFPTFKLAARYALTGSQYCLVPKNSNYEITLRGSAENKLADLTDEDLGESHSIREVLLACKPHMDVQHGDTIVGEVSFFVKHKDVAGNFAELVETLCRVLPDQSAEAVRISLGFLRNSGFLEGNVDEDASSRILRTNIGISTFEAGIAFIRASVTKVLDQYGWPITDETLDHLFPSQLV
jgi:hypothetical protein